MSNYNNITARWDRGTLSEAIISRQFDDAATLVAFAGVPTGDDDEDAVYHLIVWMATEEGGEPHEQAPILLDAPEWLISNFYTQFTQVIRFQLCIQTEGGAYEAHSPIFSGRIARSLRHDGTTDDINTSVLFDPYKKYVDEKAMAAGAVVIDADLDEDSENPVQNKIVAGAITEVNERLSELGDGVPTEVRQAIYTLLTKGLYNDTGLTDEIAVIESWAAVVTAIVLNQTSITINGANTNQLVATTTPAGGTVTWASSDTSVATVSNSGLVTGVGNGTATITASCGGKTATCTATVTGFATLTGITAVYSGGSVYDTATLDDLKSDLVVTAHYSDNTSQTVTNYELSGTLTEGTSAITVSYNGKTTTFNVTVSSVLYKLTDGTHEFTGTNTGYVTISNHSHVKAQRTNASGSNKNYNFICLSDLEFNGTEMNANTNINNHDTLFTLASGDVVRFVVSNVTGDFDDYTIGFRKASGTTSVAAVASQTTDCDTEVTVDSAGNAGCLFLYMGTQNATNKNIECDIAVYVNNVRYF